MALPRGARAPKVQSRVHWHWFHAPSFAVGHTQLVLEATTPIGLWMGERCIVDAFRMHGRVGADVAVEALKRWLRGRGNHPGRLLAIAQRLPRGAPELLRTRKVLQ